MADLDLELRTHAAYDLAERAIAILRHVLVWPTPLNYELGLHYVADPSGPLAQAVDRLIAEGNLHSDDFGDKLAHEFLPRLRLHDEVLEAGEALEREIDEVSGTLTATAVNSKTAVEKINAAGASLSKAATLEDARQRLDVAWGAMRDTEDLVRLQEQALRASAARVEKLRSHMDRARREAMTDPLTTLPNRRAFDREIARACADSDTDGTALVLAMIDIDHFKRFNDTWGHQTGDQVIRFVGSTLKAFARPPRMAARYGGEEFAVVMPREEALAVPRDLNALREAIGGRQLRRRTTGEALGQVTVSIGFARREPGEAVSALIERADAALYASKRRGRDQVSGAPDARVTLETAAA